MKLLIVDDSAMMRGIVIQAIQDNMQGSSPEYLEAVNGKEALDFLNNQDIRLVLLDWNMPVLDGLSFVKDVRGRGIKTPIVMITSVTDEDRILQAGKAGVNSYIEKPVRGSRLWDQIKEFLI